jgi:hypothetical protein
MIVHGRIPQQLYLRVRADLGRSHDFAAERVGFLSARIGISVGEERLVLFSDYYSVPDDKYIDDPRSGARIDGTAIREALQHVLDTGNGLFHVHHHAHRGKPGFSWMDQNETPRIVSSLQVAGPDQAHGMMLLSYDFCIAHIWLPHSNQPVVAQRVTVIGYPLQSFDAEV